MSDLEQRFWARVRKTRGCWPWIGHRQGKGYGQMEFKGPTKTHTLTAHRLSYMLNVGSIPEGMVIDHVCQNKSCVNPSHLEPVTHAENCRRRENNRRFKK